MIQIHAHVNIQAPMMGTFRTHLAGSAAMHVVGNDQIEAFLASRADCQSRDALKALAFELAKRTWKDPTSMARDYPSVSFRALPKVAFNLSPCSVTVDCHIDFCTGTVLIECCRPATCRPQCRPPREKAA